MYKLCNANTIYVYILLTLDIYSYVNQIDNLFNKYFIIMPKMLFLRFMQGSKRKRSSTDVLVDLPAKRIALSNVQTPALGIDDGTAQPCQPLSYGPVAPSTGLQFPATYSFALSNGQTPGLNIDDSIAQLLSYVPVAPSIEFQLPATYSHSEITGDMIVSHEPARSDEVKLYLDFDNNLGYSLQLDDGQASYVASEELMNRLRSGGAPQIQVNPTLNAIPLYLP